MGSDFSTGRYQHGIGVLRQAASAATNLFAASQNAKFTSGARCVLKINDEVVAWATAISWNIVTDQTEIRTIDSYLPWELAPRIMSISGSISGLRVPNSSPVDAGISQHMFNFMTMSYITIEVRDDATDALLLYVGKAAITSRSEDLRAEQLGTINLTWKGLAWRDEASPNYPNDPKSTTKITKIF